MFRPWTKNPPTAQYLQWVTRPQSESNISPISLQHSSDKTATAESMVRRSARLNADMDEDERPVDELNGGPTSTDFDNSEKFECPYVAVSLIRA